MSTIKKYIFWACTCLLSLHTILNCKHVGPYEGSTGPHWLLAGLPDRWAAGRDMRHVLT